MRPINYAYDVLHYETYETVYYCYAIRLKKYRLKSKRPLVVASVTRTPVINDFSELPDNYEDLCVTIECRLRPSLDLAQMKALARQILRDNFLQQCFDFDFIKD